MKGSLKQLAENIGRWRSAYRKEARTVAILIILVGIALFSFSNALGAVSRTAQTPRSFEVVQREGFRSIVEGLHKQGLIKSATAFETFAIITGSAFNLKPGSYEFSPSMTSYEILNDLILGSRHEVSVLIPEGLNSYDIDRILSEASITKPGAFAAEVKAEKKEGELFPDTYKFFTDSAPADVVGKFLENFTRKIAMLKESITNTDLILASILDKEVPNTEDQKIVAGILKKRMANGIPLQVDASICYLKESKTNISCYPLSQSDFKIDSPYNTYLHTGLPPAPIGNPGLVAINAALHPTNSPYFYYVSDPKTGKTIFAKTLDEHIENQRQYFKN